MMSLLFASICTLLLLSSLASLYGADPSPLPFHESFGPAFDASRFTTRIPNKNTEVRNGALWTHGSSGGKYPPMVYLPVEGKDLTISFRYRHLGNGRSLWFFVDGDDGFGSVDHMLRVKLLRDSVVLQVDSHSRDASHPLRQNNRAADAISGAYRLNEHLAPEKVDLQSNAWREVRLVFLGENVRVSVDDTFWTKELSRPNFHHDKRKLLWMQDGGEQGLEIDEIHIETSVPRL